MVEFSLKDLGVEAEKVAEGTGENGATLESLANILKSVDGILSKYQTMQALKPFAMKAAHAEVAKNPLPASATPAQKTLSGEELYIIILNVTTSLCDKGLGALPLSDILEHLKTQKDSLIPLFEEEAKKNVR